MKPSHSRPISLRMVRRVWAAVSAHPQASIRTTATRLGIACTTVRAAVHVLQAAGYITSIPGHGGTRRVLVPFITTGDDAA